MNPNPRNIILFDGVCNLCNGAVQFILKRDKKQVFHFASLQSAAGRELAKQHLSAAEQQTDSIVYIKEGRGYIKSTAALLIAKELSGAWPLLYAFIIIPAPVRNLVYNFIAANRYRFFGKKEACMLPLPQWKARFLD